MVVNFILTITTMLEALSGHFNSTAFSSSTTAISHLSYLTISTVFPIGAWVQWLTPGMRLGTGCILDVRVLSDGTMVYSVQMD